MIFLEEDFTPTAVAEARAFCPTGEGNGVDNSCSSTDGAASSEAATAVAEAIASAPKTTSPSGPRIWTPGQPTGDVTSAVLASPPTVRSDDGRKIISTSIPDAHVYPFAGREWVSTIDAGAHLSAMQAESRGGVINTATGRGPSLSHDDFEYITSAITDQANSATGRGITPLFYSPEELDRQLEEFSALIPQVRGGRMKDGTLVEQEDAEHLFRVVQALTSPNASPFINMQRTDSLLQKFFNGDGRITTGDALGVTGPGIRKSLQRFQTIVDTLGRRTDGSVDTAAGLKAARELLQHRMLPTRDVEKFFADFASPEDSEGAWKPKNYLVGEMVPVFSTFGPKVGPFYENNQGNHDPLTADVWFTRTWGRVTGELVIPGNPEKAVEQSKDLMRAFKGASEEHYHGIEPRDLEDAIRRTVETGAVDDILRAWSADRLRHYAAGDYKEKRGVGGRLNRLAKNIVENDTALMGDPGAGSRRSNMIKVMQAAARRTGMPVAYLQDVLWQDEQDAYAAIGAKTATNVGQLSLYSDQIRRIASDQEKARRPMAGKEKKEKKNKRSYDPSQEEFYDDYDRGGREQMLWETTLADVSDQEFADAVIALAENARRAITTSGRRLGRPESRSNDCGANGPGGGGFQKGNKCSGGGGENSKEASSRIASGEKASKVLQGMGYRKMNFSAIDKMLEKADDDERAAILHDLDALADAIKIEPRLADTPIRVGRMEEIFANREGELDGLLGETSETKLLSAVANAEGDIAVFTNDGAHDESEYADGWSTAKGGAAVILHELAHVDHYKSAMDAFPHPGEEELPGVDPVDYSLLMAESAGTKLLKSDKALRAKVAKVSEYATTDVFEFVAEYSTAVKLGSMKSDKDLDRLCKTVGAAIPKRLVK